MDYSWQKFLAGGVVVVHGIALLAFLAMVSRNGSDDFIALIVVPPSQVTLLAMWAMLSRRPAWLRFPLAMASVIVLWLLTMAALYGKSIDAEQHAMWAVMFITQWTVVVGGIVIGTLGSRLVSSTFIPATHTDNVASQFRLRDIFIWTASLAALLGLLRVAVSKLGLTQETIATDDDLQLTCFVAVCSALVALVLFGWLALPRWWHIAAGLPVAAAVIGGLFWAEAFGLQKLVTGSWSGIIIAIMMFFTLIQSGVILATLILLRISGWFGRKLIKPPVSHG